jgi:gliding motility-associated-like protein
MSKITFSLLFVFIFISGLKAQLIVTNTATPAQLVQNNLVGPGVTVSNVTFNGAPANTVNPQIGLFDGTNTTLGMAEGILMTSGNVNAAVGPNNNGGISAAMGSSAFDADLNAICAFGVYDAAILEFDFIPMGDTVEFKFRFASDEYIEYVGSGINDAFGIFLSGPGITGPFSNSAVNLAVVPGTSTPISIDNISPFNNSMYYIDNGDGFTAPYNSNPMYVQYDGMTVTLTAVYPVTCGTQYHIKFAIGDGSDAVIDSGVFIESGSFQSDGVNVSLITPTLPNATQGVVYEGCLLGSTVDFTFVRPDTMLNDTVFFSLGGNAVNGVDYSTVGTSYVVFPPGQDSVTLSINIPNDGVTEGVDTLIVTTLGMSACGNPINNSAFLYINDPYDVLAFAGNDTVYNCPGQTYSYNGIPLNGNPPYNYSWSNAITGQSVNYTITQLGGDTLILSVTDGCGYLGYDTIYFSQVPPTPLTVFAGFDTTLACAGQSVMLNGAYFGGPGDVPLLVWNNGVVGGANLVQPLQTTTYVLTATNTCNQTATDSVTVFVPPFTPFTLFVSDTLITVPCAGNNANFTAYALSGGAAPYQYAWSNGDTDSILNVVVNGNTTYTFTVTDQCGLDSTISVRVDVAGGTILFEADGGRHCRNTDSTAILTFSLSGGVSPYAYAWSAPAGVTNIDTDTITQSYLVSNAQSGVYVFTVTDGCGTTAQDTVSVSMVDCDLNIPNVISPNGDGSNDVFYVDGLQYHPNSILRVYNRWGVQVFYDPNYQNNWNGGGLSAGTYYYVLVLTDGTVPSQYNGTLTILY